MNIKIKQHDITDCGAACLASVAAHYSLKLPISRIRQYAHTDKKGTNVLGIIEAASKLGFTAKGVKGPIECLAKIPKPVIAHVIVKNVLYHYVVIYKVTSRQITIMDPAKGHMISYSYDEFSTIWTGILILLLPDEGFSTGNKKDSILKRFWELIKPHKTVLTQALFGAAVYTILGLSMAIYIQKITDYVLVEGNRNLLNLLSIIMVALLILKLLIGVTKSIFTIKTGQQIDARLILGYYKHLLHLPQEFFDTMRVGEIISRIGDAIKIRVFINDMVINLIVNAFIVVFSFALMFTYYWKLALFMLLIIPLYSIIYFIINKLNKKVQRRIMEQSADLEAQFVESLNGIGTIKRFGMEQYANLKTETRFIPLLKTIYTSSLNSVFSGTSAGAVSELFTILLLWIGSYAVLNNQITAGELLSFYALIGYFTGPAASLIGMNKTIQDALIAADRLFEIIDLEREETGNKIELTTDMIGDIKFQGVSFRYGTRTNVFENLNLTIPIGTITAVTGESGSGKSTLMSLLQNIYPVTSGKIHIGKYDIRNISVESLRNLISIVPQQIDLFTGNFVENIAIGENTPDIQRILSICDELGMTEFIENIPNGFYAFIGENGTSLSGGQRQRLAIARALYKNPAILILDEATSSLDSLSEQYIQRAINNLHVKGKTIIMIAHRMSTIKYANKIIVLDHGKVVE